MRRASRRGRGFCWVAVPAGTAFKGVWPMRRWRDDDKQATAAAYSILNLMREAVGLPAARRPRRIVDGEDVPTRPLPQPIKTSIPRRPAGLKGGR